MEGRWVRILREDVFRIQSTDFPILELLRWPASKATDMPFSAPVWNWVEGTPAYMQEYKLRFPRVLAIAVDPDTAAQGNDGNLGVAVPG